MCGFGIGKAIVPQLEAWTPPTGEAQASAALLMSAHASAGKQEPTH